LIPLTSKLTTELLMLIETHFAGLLQFFDVT
jgi:hypothetical protein